MSDAIKTAKSQAEKMSTRLKQLGVEIKRTQCLEAIAAIYNYPDWNRFVAAVESGRTEPVVPVMTASEVTLGERYIIGGLEDVSDAHYPRSVFIDLVNSGFNPVYVELRDASRFPFNNPVADRVKHLDVSFDWDGNLSSPMNVINDPAAMFLLGQKGPLHIAMHYNAEPQSQAEKEGKDPDYKVVRERIRDAFFNALTHVNRFLSRYVSSVASPYLIIDEAGMSGSAATSIYRLSKDQKVAVVSDIFSLAPAALFMNSGDAGHVLGSRLGVPAYDFGRIGPHSPQDPMLLSSVKRVFPAILAQPEMDKKRERFKQLFITCNMAGFDFAKKAELTVHLLGVEAWEDEFARLVETDDGLVELMPCLWMGILQSRGNLDMSQFTSLSDSVSTLVGERFKSAMETLKGKFSTVNR